MKGWSSAAIAAGVALLTGCHLAAPPGGAMAPGKKHAPLAPASQAERLRLLTAPDLCACPLGFDASGSSNARPVDLVVNNFKVGIARQPTFNLVFNPNGTVSGTFSYTGVNYEGFGPPIAAYPQGSSITGTISGTATGVEFATAGPFSLFNWPPPFAGAFVAVPGTFTTGGGALTAEIGLRRVIGTESLPVTNDDVLGEIVIRSLPTNAVLEIYSTTNFDDSDSFDAFLLESRCNGRL